MIPELEAFKQARKDFAAAAEKLTDLKLDIRLAEREGGNVATAVEAAAVFTQGDWYVAYNAVGDTARNLAAALGLDRNELHDLYLAMRRA